MFDSIGIPAVGVTLARAGGPLERGLYRSGTWVPDNADQPVYADGFAVSATSRSPYFDTEQVSDTTAVLMINPASGRIWLAL